MLDALQRDPAQAPAGRLLGDPGEAARPQAGDHHALDLSGGERLEPVAASRLDAVAHLPALEVAAELRVRTVGRLGGDHPPGADGEVDGEPAVTGGDVGDESARGAGRAGPGGGGAAAGWSSARPAPAASRAGRGRGAASRSRRRPDASTSPSRQRRAEPPSIDARARSIPSARSAARSAAQSAAAALSRTTSRAGPGSPSSTARSRAAFGRTSPPRSAASGAGRSPSEPGRARTRGARRGSPRCRRRRR